MQKPNTPIEKLDTVLTILQKQNSYKTRDEIEDILIASFILINQDDLVRIVDKLVNDGFVIETKLDRNGIHMIPKYLISYSGHLFDGYRAKSLRDSSDAEQQRLEIERLKMLDRTSESNQFRLNRLTRWLAVGTIALALMEIIKFIYEVDPCIKSYFEKIL